MRVASSVMASIQQAQNRDNRNESRGAQDKNEVGKNVPTSGVAEPDKGTTAEAAQATREEKVARIKDEIKRGTYRLDLASTADKMARSLLNV